MYRPCSQLRSHFPTITSPTPLPAILASKYLAIGWNTCKLLLSLVSGLDCCVVTLQADAQRRRWADEFSQQPENQWASEFERTQTGAAASISGTHAQTDAATRGDTKALADLLSNDANPKMKNSKFLQFISKMSRGEIILEDNEVGWNIRNHNELRMMKKARRSSKAMKEKEFQ